MFAAHLFHNCNSQMSTRPRMTKRSSMGLEEPKKAWSVKPRYELFMIGNFYTLKTREDK